MKNKEKLKHDKTNLSFQCSKIMKYLRTPKDIWQDLIMEFNFTIDCCASHKNHLLPRYYTIDDDCLTKGKSIEDLNKIKHYCDLEIQHLKDGKKK